MSCVLGALVVIFSLDSNRESNLLFELSNYEIKQTALTSSKHRQTEDILNIFVLESLVFTQI